MLSTTDVLTGEDTLSGNWTLCIRQSVITSRVIEVSNGPNGWYTHSADTVRRHRHGFLALQLHTSRATVQGLCKGR